MTCSYLIVCCVDICGDLVVMKTEADSNDITQYTGTPDYRPIAGMFDFSYAAFMSLTHCTQLLVE